MPSSISRVHRRQLLARSPSFLKFLFAVLLLSQFSQCVAGGGTGGAKTNFKTYAAAAVVYAGTPGAGVSQIIAQINKRAAASPSNAQELKRSNALAFTNARGALKAAGSGAITAGATTAGATTEDD